MVKQKDNAIGEVAYQRAIEFFACLQCLGLLLQLGGSLLYLLLQLIIVCTQLLGKLALVVNKPRKLLGGKPGETNQDKEANSKIDIAANRGEGQMPVRVLVKMCHICQIEHDHA